MFHVELARAMTRRGVGPTALARAVGVAPTQIHTWRKGTHLPRHATVVRLADALEWDNLVRVSLVARTRKCQTCAVPIVSTSTGAHLRRYCSPECQGTGYQREHLKRRSLDAVVAKRRLAVYAAAVDAFCRRCASGFCPDASCELRDVSPFVAPSRRHQ